MKAVEALQQARDYLMEHGWHRGSLAGPSGTVCAGGALKAVTCGLGESLSFESIPHMKYLESAAQRLGSPGASDGSRGPTTYFNDLIAQGFNDVMDLYDEALRLAKEDEARGRGTRAGVAEPALSSEVAGG